MSFDCKFLIVVQSQVAGAAPAARARSLRDCSAAPRAAASPAGGRTRLSEVPDHAANFTEISNHICYLNVIFIYIYFLLLFFKNDFHNYI